MKIIQETIERETIQIRGYNCWMSRKYIIRDMLDRLEPSIPEDGSVGRIAFNVPNKDRMKIKTGRFLTRKLNLNSGFLSDKSIVTIANIINSELFPGIETELVSGRQITENYRKEIGAVSCMTPSGEGGGPTCTRLYESNPNRFQMLTMFYMNDSARAIVHKLDNGQYFLDRVYASCEMLKEKMREYAIEQGWHYRESDEACNYAVSCEENILVVSGLDYDDNEIPYMDSLTNGCTCNQGLTISMCGCQDYELTNTDGQIETGYTCDSCNDRISEDDQISIGNGIYCSYCVNESYSYCEHCCEYIPNDDMIHIEDTDEWLCSNCIDDKAYKCEDCGDYNKNDYRVIEDRCYCDSCAENYPVCIECGEQFIENDYIDENGLCEDCRPEEVVISNRQLNLPTEYVGQLEFKDAN